MDKPRKLIIAGNWKMNKTVAEALALVGDLKLDLANVKEVDIVVCPPFTALEAVSKATLDSNLKLGAQNMSAHNFGAFTGEVAPGMLKEFSVRYVILGHSERRQYQKETDALIAKKAVAAHAFIRGLLEKMFDAATAKKVRIQYGGSVKPANARELMSQPDVDGALVGGASLEARSFADIVKNSV